MTTNNTGFGLTNWGEKNQTSKPEQKADVARIEFLRLKEGNNILRIVTAPAKYWQIKFEDGKSKFGTRVNCAYPGVDKADCPTVQAGYRPKKRYLAGVIQRSSEGDSVKLFDMSVLVYEQLQSFQEDPEVGTPDSYDINVRFNPKSSSPGGFYSVIPRARSPLSGADVELIGAVGQEVIEENLVRLSTPRSPEKVLEHLKKLGWDGTTKVVSIKGNDDKQLADTSDDDYSFDKPANG